MHQTDAAPDQEPRLFVLFSGTLKSYEVLHSLMRLPYAVFCRLASSSYSPLVQIEIACKTQSLPLENVKYLVLDDLDIFSQQVIHGCITELMNSYPTLQIYMKTRILPVSIINDATLNHFMPNHYSGIELPDYFQQTQQPNRHVIEVRALGTGHVWVDGQLIDSWEGTLPFLLFFYIVDRNKVTRDEIFETFWYDMPKSEATNIFHVTKSKLNEILGLEFTTYSSSFYHMSANIVLSYDVNSFRELLTEWREHKDNLHKLQAALNLTNGHYLAGYDAPWINSRRIELLNLYREANLYLAHYHRNNGHLEKAVRLFAQVLQLDPSNQQVTYSLMRLYHELHLYCDALVLYERIVHATSDMDVIIEEHITDLHIEMAKLCSQQ